MQAGSARPACPGASADKITNRIRTGHALGRVDIKGIPPNSRM